MDILKFLQTFNQECSHADRIKESPNVETPGSDNKPKKQYSLRSRSVVQCILSQYDPVYQSIPHSEKHMYLKQRIMEIGSQIEEVPQEFYDPFKFNPKVMKCKIIQLSLQMSLENKNTLSSLLYLNELYKRNFTIVVEDNYFPTCPKNYPIETIVYEYHQTAGAKEKGFYWIHAIDVASLQEGPLESIPMENDLGKSSIYQSPLMPISKYKSDELKKMCQDQGISLKTESGKAKVKKVLYDELTLSLLTQ